MLIEIENNDEKKDILVESCIHTKRRFDNFIEKGFINVDKLFDLIDELNSIIDDLKDEIHYLRSDDKIDYEKE